MRLLRRASSSRPAYLIFTAALGLVACTMLSGCLVAGYGTNTGGFLFPGGFGLVFILGLLLWFLLRRR